MTPIEVIDKIARGDVFVIPLTIPETWTMLKTQRQFSRSNELGRASEFAGGGQGAGA